MDTTSVVDRVRDLIRQKGVPQKDFAAAIGLEPDKLSKSLSGRRHFSSLELALIAEFCNVTVDWILSGTTSPTPSMAARANRTDAADSATISAAVRRYSDAHEQLELLTPRPPLPALPPTHGNRFVDAAESVAAWARAQMLDHGFDVVDRHQDALLAGVEATFAVDVAVTTLPRGLDGCAWQTPSMRLLIAARTTLWARQRFSVGHELGHLLFRDAQDLIAEPVESRAKDLTEKRANSFAAALLMPADFLKEEAASGLSEAGFVTLVNRLFVSPTSLGWRLFNLGLISDKQRVAWSSMTAEQSAMRVDGAELILTERRLADSERLPQRLAEDHLRAYRTGATSARPLAQLFGIEPGDVIELFGQQ